MQFYNLSFSDLAMTKPKLVIWYSLTLLTFTLAPVFTSTFTSIRVPFSITPVDSIPRPDDDDSDINDDPELYSKATIYDDLILSQIYDLNRVLTRGVVAGGARGGHGPPCH